jgi:FMN-dependent NADH-azoreductase
MKNDERKKNFRINTQRFNVSISKVVYKKFKEKMKQEELQSTRVLSQFIANYVLYLDRSFVKNNHRSKEKKKGVLISVTNEQYCKFAEKVSKENIDVSRVIEQFMENYIDFIDKKKK